MIETYSTPEQSTPSSGTACTEKLGSAGWARNPFFMTDSLCLLARRTGHVRVSRFSYGYPTALAHSGAASPYIHTLTLETS